MIKNTYKKQHGFSLIETLVAISILMIAIAGPLSLVQAGLFSSNHQRNQVTATYLAQEALEYIKNLRDSNSYTPTHPWLTGPDGISLLTTCGVSVSGCYVDPHQKLPGDTFIRSVSLGDLPLRQATIGGVFSYSYDINGTVSPYKRTVVITSIDGNGPLEEVRVSVTIVWKDGAVPRSYTVSENIYNYEQDE